MQLLHHSLDRRDRLIYREVGVKYLAIVVRDPCSRGGKKLPLCHISVVVWLIIHCFEPGRLLT